MAVRTRVEPIDRDIALILDHDLSPAAQSAALASFALDALAEAEAQNAAVLGQVPPHDTYVDGIEGASVQRVRPDGTVVFEFRLVDDALLWISEQLVRRAPVRSGRFAASFILLADGVEADIATAPPIAGEYIIANTQPYSRKIERGQSPQAPDGIFEAIALLAKARFGNSADIRFGFATILDGVAIGGKAGDRHESRTPAIYVRPR